MAWKQLLQKDHPVWPLLRTVAAIMGLAIILRANASSFDMTELKTIAEMAALIGAVEMAKRKVTKDKQE